MLRVPSRISPGSEALHKAGLSSPTLITPKTAFKLVKTPRETLDLMETDPALGAESLEPLFSALRFAADRHAGQLRKNGGPYIQHPIAVAELLVRVGRVSNVAVLQAAFLHDVLEDTPTTSDQLESEFGQRVRALVEEVTDDMSRPREERQRLQIQTAPQLSPGAQQIRVADKICNVMDLSAEQPTGWSLPRKRDYLDWAEKVVRCCRGCNQALEEHFGDVLRSKRQLFSA